MKPSVNFLRERISSSNNNSILDRLNNSISPEYITSIFEYYVDDILSIGNKEFYYLSGLSDETLVKAYVFDHYLYAFIGGFGESKKIITNLNDNQRRNSFIMLKIYLKKLKQEIEKNPLLFDRFLIFSLDLDELRKIPGIDANDIDELKELKKKYDQYNKDLITKYNNGDTLTNEEVTYLLKFFIGQIPTDDEELKKVQHEFFENCLISLIKKSSDDIKNIDKELLNFITKYEFFYCLDQNFSSRHSARKDANGVFIFCDTFSNSGSGTYAYAVSNLYASFNWNKFTDLSKHLVSVAHEAKHFVQNTIISYSNLNSMNVEGHIRILLDKFGPKKNNNGDYSFNYWSQEREIDANKYGYFFARNLVESLRKYINNSEVDKKFEKMVSGFDYGYKSCELQEHIVMRNRGNGGFRQFPWSYKFDNLDSIMYESGEDKKNGGRKSSKLLQEYFLLETFYNYDGSSKSLIDVFSSEKDLFGKSYKYTSNIYLDFCRHRISKGDFDLLFDSSFLSTMQKENFRCNFSQMFHCFEEDKKRLLDRLKKDFSSGKFNWSNFDVMFSKLEYDFQAVSKSIEFCSKDDYLIESNLINLGFKNTVSYIDEIVNLFLQDINKTLDDIVSNIDEYDSNKLVFNNDSAFVVLKKLIDKAKRIMLLRSQLHNGDYDEQFTKLYNSISVISDKIVARCKDSKGRIEKTSLAKDPRHMKIVDRYDDAISFCGDPFIGPQISELITICIDARRDTIKSNDEDGYELFIKSLYSKYKSFKCNVNFIECLFDKELITSKETKNISFLAGEFINLIENVPENFRINNLKALEMVAYFGYVQEKFSRSYGLGVSRSCVEFSKGMASEKRLEGRKK